MIHPAPAKITLAASANARRVAQLRLAIAIWLLSFSVALAADSFLATEAINRYPRLGSVSTKRGFSAVSASASRILLMAVFRL
jgi:hypothetical protein